MLLICLLDSGFCGYKENFYVCVNIVAVRTPKKNGITDINSNIS